MCNCATKSDLKGATGIDTSENVKKPDLTGLKSNVDKLDIDKLKTVQIDLSKVNNIVDNEVVRKTMYDQLVTKVHAIDSSKLVKKLTATQKLKRLRIEFLFMINTLLLLNLKKILAQLLMRKFSN